MNVLISGGTGLIGQALSESLLQDGHDVWALTRNPQAVKAPAGVQLLEWDGRTTQGWGDRAGEMDVIVNLAGENIGALPWTNERKARIRTSRVEAGRVIVEALQQQPARRTRVLIQSSAIGYYGTSDDETFNERSFHGVDFQSSVAVDWEASTQPVERLGVRRAIIRSGVVLASQGGALQRFLYPWRLSLGGPMGGGQQWLSWVHVDDEIGAIRFIIEREDAMGPFNLTAPEPMRNVEFGRTLAQVMGKRFGLPIPGFALQALLGEMSSMVLKGQRVLPERLLALGYSFKFPTLRSALEDLLK